MKVASKIRLLASALALCSAIAVGLVMYGGYRETISALEVEVLERRVQADVSRLESSFHEVSHDIRLLEGLPEIRGLVDGSHRSRRELEDDLAQTFQQLLLAKPHYVQARLIGVEDGGRERVRIDRTESGVVRCPDSELQRKGHRNYFLETMENVRGEIYYSDIDLNRENGEIEVPHRPMLRVAMPVYDSMDTFWGIVIINLDFRGFGEDFIGRTAQRFGHYLCNAEGDFLLHPLAERTFGFDLGTRYRLQDEFPEFGGFMDSAEEGMTLALDRGSGSPGIWFHLRKVTPLEDGRLMFYGVSAQFDEVISASNTIVLRTVLIMLVLLALAFLGALGVSLLITEPIKKITTAARSLGAGKDDVDLPTDRRDEIGVLASSFLEMRGAIREQEGRILEANGKLSTANRDLEHFAHISSHELREPLNRIGGLSRLLELEWSPGLAASLKSEAVAALRLITDFRVFSGLSDGLIVRERVDLGSVVQSILDGFSNAIVERRVSVSRDPLPSVDVYGSLVEVLYRNLVENALKYARGEGVTLKFTCEEGDAGMILGVFNSGSSIAEADKETIFSLFTRLDRGVEGTGVGLSVCKRIVERHTGKIWIETGDDFVHFKFTLKGNHSDGS